MKFNQRLRIGQMRLQFRFSSSVAFKEIELIVNSDIHITRFQADLIKHACVPAALKLSLTTIFNAIC